MAIEKTEDGKKMFETLQFFFKMVKIQTTHEKICLKLVIPNVIKLWFTEIMLCHRFFLQKSQISSEEKNKWFEKSHFLTVNGTHMFWLQEHQVYNLLYGCW